MNDVKLSIVIACYNAAKEVAICLDSIFSSNWQDFEVIVVDDCSTDNSQEIVGKYPCRVFSTKRNSGPATARNIGVNQAESDIIFFLDADTRVEPNSIEQIYSSFCQAPDRWAVIALPNIISLRKGMAPDYNAIKNHFTLFSAPENGNYFTTQMGAIRKEVFLRLGGFDEAFTGADIEDIEFGMRIPEGRVFINKSVIIGHHFPYLGSILKKYFKRAILLTKLVKRKKELCSAHATKKGMLSILLVLANVFLLPVAWIHPFVLTAFLVTLLSFLVINGSLFAFVMSQRGPSYALPAFLFEYLFSLAIGFGGIVGTLSPMFDRERQRLNKIINLLKMFFAKQPTYLIFYVTAFCNSRCMMCFNWDYNTNVKGDDELTLDEIQKITQKIQHLQYVTLGGGEPFLRKDIDKICELFYRNCRTEIFSIPTNCLLPEKIGESTERMLLACPTAVFRVSLSIDGIGKLHDTIRGVVGNYDKVKETYAILDGLRSRYPNLEIIANTTFSSLNQNEIRNIHKTVSSEFKLDMYGMTLVRGNARNEESKNFDIDKYKEAVAIFEEGHFSSKGESRHIFQRLLSVLPIFTRREVLNTLQSKKRTFSCQAIKKSIVMDSFGNLFACEVLPYKLGNLRDHCYSLDNILNLPVTIELRKKIKNRSFCNCTWECAIQNSLVFNPRKYLPIIVEAFFKKKATK